MKETQQVRPIDLEDMGQKIDLGGLAGRVMAQHLSDMVALQNLLKTVRFSKRALQRCFIAAMQLPNDNLVVQLVSDDEYKLFGLSQRLINCRFTLTTHNIIEEKKARDEMERLSNEKKEKKDG